MFSSLQKSIIIKCWEKRGICGRAAIEDNFSGKTSQAKMGNYKKIITVSIERLIERGILTGYGIKTKDKLFINKIKLTPLGRRQAAAILKRKQLALPLPITRHASSQDR